MRNFQDTFETRKRSCISAFSICITVPLSYATHFGPMLNLILLLFAILQLIATDLIKAMKEKGKLAQNESKMNFHHIQKSSKYQIKHITSKYFFLAKLQFQSFVVALKLSKISRMISCIKTIIFGLYVAFNKLKT